MSKYHRPKNDNNFMTFIERGLGNLIDKLFARGSTFAVFASGELTKRWSDLESHEPKLAILEADKLVDEVLKRAGLAGESMADRLRKAEKFVDRNAYQEMWDAHKLRNQLAHEMDYQINENDARLALGKMKRFLTALGAFKNE